MSSDGTGLVSRAVPDGQFCLIHDPDSNVIGTGNGLISYQSDAIEGGDRFQNVRAYPNPVRPEYTGLITITGLITDTQIRITDINGNLIYETQSNGGVATWDGCNNSGSPVVSGVYFAHCLSNDGKQKHITKILIIR